MKKFSSLSTLTHLIHQVNGFLPQHITLQHRLVKDLQIDSVKLFDLLLRLEKIGVIFNESQISSQITVGDIVIIMEHADVKMYVSAKILLHTSRMQAFKLIICNTVITTS
ncbi:type III secretion system protein [Erwinia pyrifoliae]|uniref:Acyl carrier protein n=1 Tax=Erwinia pyrifoliae TaxID=79967 RepID=A0ABY5XDX0_ERWPY|nr:type III secretion system protein [Erwinia pyrifoliae]MCT2387380.1 acyl carrier protein [Erwinia pyrifoliae]MCU8587020.1 acyl carrier protein [Erwinia pyrifoliae]UWS30887.1 acyl carrier protein [Erwinia pyrifoliae]UWS35315.1 acyl carrier protein [Erwinia pyrifoliae]UXK13906.1 acyl carrier protein [Erwinia pyrifoliae]